MICYLIDIVRTYAIALLAAVVPGAAWSIPLCLMFVFRSQSEKRTSKRRYSTAVSTTFGHRVRPDCIELTLATNLASFVSREIKMR